MDQGSPFGVFSAGHKLMALSAVAPFSEQVTPEKKASNPSPRIHVIWDRAPAVDLATAEASEAVRPGTNKPLLRQQRILTALREHFDRDSVTIEHNELEATAATLDILYEPTYTQALREAWQSAASSGDQHWFHTREAALIPLNVPRGHPLMSAPELLRELPAYKRLALYCNDTMTPVYADTYSRAARSVRSSLMTAEHVLAADRKQVEGEGRTVFYALNSAPGHHSDQSISLRGYCAYNNVAFAAHYLQATLKAPISVLDLDAHAGDGTQTLFYDRGDILTQSLHLGSFEYPSFMGGANEIGIGAGRGANCNYPCPPRTAWPHYRTLLMQALARHRQHKAKVLLLAFGADTFCADPDMTQGSGFALELSDYYEMGVLIGSSLATDEQVLVTQEGGYDLANVGAVVTAFLAGLSAGLVPKTF